MTNRQNDEFLNSLYRVKRDCLTMIATAEAHGDLKKAQELQVQIAHMNVMIKQKDGDVSA